ncbi:MAG: 50S ribosomal protein L25 [Gemmatimonadaceae bacterium]
MATANLSATIRTETGKGAARKLRAGKQVPAVIYGHHRDPQPLALDTREVERLLDRVAYETTVIELTLGETMARTIIREIQRHPFKRQILHIDFQELVAGEMIVVNVPLVIVGTSPGVRTEGGTLDHVLRELEVEVDPANIPNHIDVDVSELGLNQSIHVRDLKLPEGIAVLNDEDAPVVICAPPRVEAEVAPAAGEVVEGEAGAEPEVIRKAKTDDETPEAK